jgi:hypothetical protein
MGNDREQIIELKDGRTIFKTHNGFKSFVQSKKGEVTEVSDVYYGACKRVALHALKNK